MAATRLNGGRPACPPDQEEAFPTTSRLSSEVANGSRGRTLTGSSGRLVRRVDGLPSDIDYLAVKLVDALINLCVPEAVLPAALGGVPPRRNRALAETTTTTTTTTTGRLNI